MFYCVYFIFKIKQFCTIGTLFHECQYHEQYAKMYSYIILFAFVYIL
jgi:hypothetical protein